MSGRWLQVAKAKFIAPTQTFLWSVNFPVLTLAHPIFDFLFDNLLKILNSFFFSCQNIVTSLFSIVFALVLHEYGNFNEKQDFRCSNYFV